MGGSAHLGVRVVLAANVQEEVISLLDDPHSQQLVLASCGQQPPTQAELSAPYGPLVVTWARDLGIHNVASN